MENLWHQHKIYPCHTRRNEEQTLGKGETTSKGTQSVCDLTADVDAKVMRSLSAK